MNKLALKVYGKLNLSLNITGVKDGYHVIDSVVSSVSTFDTIFVSKRNDDKINFTFNAPFNVSSNTVIKAVDALKKRFGSFGADITVDKNLPLMGGMGGSSADAAGAITAISELYGFDKGSLRSVCNEVGADVYYMLSGGYARLRGIGDEVEKIDCRHGYYVVYIIGGSTLTKDVYARYDLIGGDGEVNNEELINALKNERTPTLGNMLYKAARSLNKNIEACSDALKAIGLKPNMTGSGSCVYAFSEDPFMDVVKLKTLGFNARHAKLLPYGVEFI